MKQQIINIGETDYTREQMESGKGAWFGFGKSPQSFLNTIKSYEKAGYKVEFVTSIWRKIFSLCIYKVIATRTPVEKDYQWPKGKYGNATCPDCGKKGFKTTLSPPNSYACNKCETWWVIGDQNNNNNKSE